MIASTLKKKATAEHALLLFFLAVAVVMLIDTRHFSSRAAAFPRITAIGTIVGTILLLFRSHLPWPLSRFAEDSSGILDSAVDDEAITESEEALDENDEDGPNERYVEIGDYLIHGALFTAIATSLFIAVSYFVGLLWTAPAFVASYLTVLDRPWPVIAVLSGIAFVAGLGFYVLIGIDIAGGSLFDFAEPLDELLRLLSGGRHP